MIKRSSIKRMSTPRGRIDNAVSNAMAVSLSGKKNRRRWQDLVGYTLSDLIGHLEKQFLSGMSWENYGRYGWHIDHIIPKAAFNYEIPEDIDFKKCWALDNLRPLWSSINISKKDKVDRPFQPSLLITEG